MFEKLQKITFFLTVFCLSFQVGVHFWPAFSYVQGVRIDYLSPTLYLLDILTILYIVLSFVAFRQTLQLALPENKILKILFGLFVLDLMLNIFISKSPSAHIFGIFKFLEFSLFGIFIAKTFEKKDIPYFIYALILSGIVSSSLAIWQFFIQHSVGGLWYFLGERTFDSSTIGISTVNLGQEILRPYAAFPHPNILAFFLLVATVFSTLRIEFEKKRVMKLFLISSALLFSITLFLTFSRITAVLLIWFLIYAIYTKGKRNALKFVPVSIILISIILVFLKFLPIEFFLRGLDLRQDLLAESFTIFKNSPYFGVGLNNFFINQVPLIKTISPINFQPVHNIFVLALLYLGLLGFWIFPIVFVKAIKSVLKKIGELGIKYPEPRIFYQGVLFILISIIIAGLFDHYFLTLEQGQIILSLVLGLSFTNLRPGSKTPSGSPPKVF